MDFVLDGGSITLIVLGVLAGLWIPITTVTPATWKKALKLNTGKDGARAKAAQLADQARELATDGCIAKPFRAAEVERALADAIGRRQAARTS